MECKLCNREGAISLHFKHAAKQHVCDDCLAMMGYDYQRIGKKIALHYQRTIEKSIASEVQNTLPSILERLMVDEGITFELRVI